MKNYAFSVELESAVVELLEGATSLRPQLSRDDSRLYESSPLPRRCSLSTLPGLPLDRMEHSDPQTPSLPTRPIVVAAPPRYDI